MEKVRFACPRCQTVMQTGSDRVGYDVACPHCAHRFKLIAPDSSNDVNSREANVRRQASTVGGGDVTVSRAPMGSDPQAAISGDGFKTKEAANGSFEINNSYAVPVENPRNVPVGFCCPYCRTTKLPKLQSKVSTVGWVIFTVLLLTTCVLSPIGLLVREYYRICSQCKITLGSN